MFSSVPAASGYDDLYDYSTTAVSPMTILKKERPQRIAYARRSRLAEVICARLPVDAESSCADLEAL